MKKSYLLILIVGILAGFAVRGLISEEEAKAKIVYVQSRNLNYQIDTTSKTVEEFLVEQNLLSFRLDQAVAADQEIESGMTVVIKKPIKVDIIDGGNRFEVQTAAESVGDLLFEQKISLAATDQVTPSFNSFLSQGSEVIIDRIVDLEVIETSDIPFEIERTFHSVIPYGREEVIGQGVLGKKSEKFLITYKNGVETARRLLVTEILAAPVTEKRLFGTDIKIEETREGRASWYAFRDCMCAAHPFYERGRYARVTSIASGKSIIVRINDHGPDLSVHPDRVIDLDSVAFAKLASLGTGTIGVRVELLKN